MSSFEINLHDGILLDGIGDAKLLDDNRETLQGRAKVDYGGKNGTVIDAYA